MRPATSPSRPALHLPDWLVQNRNFVLLWAAYGVAAVGDHLSEMALLRERGGLDRPDGTRVQALISFGFFLPFVLLGPLAGWWSDRFSRKTTMILADLLRAALVFNFATIVIGLEQWLEPRCFDETGQRVYTALGDFSIVLPLAVVGALAAFFSPARQSMLPTLIRDDQLVRANALISALGTIGAIISAVVGGILVQRFGPVWNFHINAATFGLSAAFVFFINMKSTRAVPHPPLEGIWVPVVAGFRYVRQHRRVFQLILLGTVFWAGAGVVISVVPAIARSIYGENYTAAGTFRGLIGIGLATGAAVMTLIGPTLPLQLAVLIALLGGGFWVLALGAAFTFKLGTVVAGLSLFGIGGAGAALLVTIMASIQRFVPDSRRGRVFGVSDMLTMGAMVAATGALGLPNIPNLDAYIPFLLMLTAGLLWGAMLWAWGVYRRGDEYPPVTRVVWQLCQFYARWMARAQRVGPCTLPVRGPVLLASNHSTGLDPFILLASSSHRLPAFVVAREQYQVPIARQIMSLNLCIPVDRDKPEKAFLANCLRFLKGGGCLCVFPVGRFQRPDEVHPEAKTGIGVLALRSGVPVIPVHISGTVFRESVYASFLTRHHAKVRYGPPIDLSAFRGRERDRTAPREVTELIMRKITELAPG